MNRTLRLRREVLADLTDAELAGVTGGTTKYTTIVASWQDDCLSLNTCRSCQICTNDGAC